MSSVSFLSPMVSLTPMLTHHYLFATLEVSWSISLVMFKDLRPLFYFLGVEATQCRHRLFLSQDRCIRDLLISSYSHVRFQTNYHTIYYISNSWTPHCTILFDPISIELLLTLFSIFFLPSLIALLGWITLTVYASPY